MDHEKPRNEGLERAERENRLNGAAFLFRLQWLRGYCPGTDFWRFALPAYDRKPPGSAFVEEYEGVPERAAREIDGVLIDWLSDRITGDEAARDLLGICKTVVELRNTFPADDVIAISAADLAERLQELGHEVQTEGRRESALRSLQALRRDAGALAAPPERNSPRR
ncbi:MAG: hypothetical protein JNK76_24025 [Planctomycetales bacterium]|nr:hypothetical protein [Planctomycetales bacterium]MBN8627761.1 hypothetical protein [Planctomycetota bacterium]